MKHIHYIGWVGYQNLGDDLMWDIFKKLSETYLGRNQFKVTVSTPKLIQEDVNPDIVVLGGGSLIIKKYIDIMYDYLKKKKDLIIWGSGYDWLVKSEFDKMLKFSQYIPDIMDNDSKKKLLEIIETAKFFGVRGPLTYQVLQKIGANMNKVIVSGDPGLLLKSNKKIHFKNSKQLKPIIGLNWGTSNNKIFGEDEIAVENQLSEAAKQFIQNGYNIYIYTMWNKDQEPNRRLYKKIGDSKNVFLSTELINQQQLIDIIKNCEFTINFKLHANVTSAATKVPFIPLGYRFKTFDFASSLNLLNNVIPTDSTNIAKEILQKSKVITKNRNQFFTNMDKYIQLYKQQLLVPFQKKFFIE
jgi:polysaccharide pyruvyl transferase WcaK-like protein